MSGPPTVDIPRPQVPGRSRGSGRLTRLVIIAVVIVGVLVAGDRVGVAVAENNMASQIKAQGFPNKPHVTIKGFPFLTQLASRDLHHVDITANGVAAGPVLLDINATLTEVKLNSSFSGATVGHISGVALITFAGLAGAAGAPGVTVAAAGPSEVKLTVDLGIASGSAIARITRAGNRITVKVISSDGIPAELLGSIGDFSVDIPPLPLGMKLQSVSVSSQGVLVRVTGQNVTFTQ